MENSTPKNVLRDKSYKFALRNISLYKYLITEKKEFVLSKQLLRSRTSIGGNVVEAGQAQSKADFFHKLSVSSFETQYWVERLRDSEYISHDAAISLLTDCSELQKILTASIKTAKASLTRSG